MTMYFHDNPNYRDNKKNRQKKDKEAFDKVMTKLKNHFDKEDYTVTELLKEMGLSNDENK